MTEEVTYDPVRGEGFRHPYGGFEHVWIGDQKCPACLVEAAPKMLEALKMLRDADDIALSEGYSGTMGYIQRANVDAAISKAEGK